MFVLVVLGGGGALSHIIVPCASDWRCSWHCAAPCLCKSQPPPLCLETEAEKKTLQVHIREHNTKTWCVERFLTLIRFIWIDLNNESEQTILISKCWKVNAWQYLTKVLLWRYSTSVKVTANCPWAKCVGLAKGVMRSFNSCDGKQRLAAARVP